MPLFTGQLGVIVEQAEQGDLVLPAGTLLSELKKLLTMTSKANSELYKHLIEVVQGQGTDPKHIYQSLLPFYRERLASHASSYHKVATSRVWPNEMLQNEGHGLNKFF